MVGAPILLGIPGYVSAMASKMRGLPPHSFLGLQLKVIPFRKPPDFRRRRDPNQTTTDGRQNLG